MESGFNSNMNPISHFIVQLSLQQHSKHPSSILVKLKKTCNINMTDLQHRLVAFSNKIFRVHYTQSERLSKTVGPNTFRFSSPDFLLKIFIEAFRGVPLASARSLGSTRIIYLTAFCRSDRLAFPSLHLTYCNIPFPLIPEYYDNSICLLITKMPTVSTLLSCMQAVKKKSSKL